MPAVPPKYHQTVRYQAALVGTNGTKFSAVEYENDTRHHVAIGSGRLKTCFVNSGSPVQMPSAPDFEFDRTLVVSRLALTDLP
jgi:hypothetical protein